MKKISYLGEAKKFPSLTAIFHAMNASNIHYLVLRNWTQLPDNVEFGEHSDLDLLIADEDIPLFHFIVRPVTTNRVMHISQRLIAIDTSYIKIDVRTPNDCYLPKKLADFMLKTRKKHKDFYIPEKRMYFWSLLYHALFQKPHVEKDYFSILYELIPKELSREQMTDISCVKKVFSQKGWDLVEPFDDWVWWRYRSNAKIYTHWIQFEEKKEGIS